MPRVNRDLQRRMAARRDRERRRPPSTRSYSFGTPQPSLAPEETVEDQPAENGSTEAEEIRVRPKSARPARELTRLSAASGARTVETAQVPFSAYKAEYAYVLNDLRRVALVIGALLLILIVLFFVLPR